MQVCSTAIVVHILYVRSDCLFLSLLCCFAAKQSRGEIKCWTINYSQKDARPSSLSGQPNNNGAQSNKKNFALLHTFTGHTKGVTALQLHPISGLAISASLDGLIRVLNLEALNELFSIQIDAGVINMRVVKLCNNQYGCLASLTDASIRIWKITSVCDFLSVAASKIFGLETFENLEGELHHHYQMRQLLNQAKERGQDSKSAQVKTPSGMDDATMPMSTTTDSGGLQKKPDTSDPSTTPVDLNDRILVTYSSQDLRAFNQKGTVLGRLEPEHIVNGIKALCVSVYQKLLFCICENDRIRVFCMRKFNFPLVYEFSLKNPGVPLHHQSNVATPPVLLALQKSLRQQAVQTGSVFDNVSTENETKPTDDDSEKPDKALDEEDIGVCCALLDVPPANSLRVPKLLKVQNHDAGSQGNNNEHSRVDPRGNPVPDYMECFLLIGLTTGSIMFLDVLNQFDVIMNFQAINGSVLSIKYRRRRKELIVYGKDYSNTFASVRIWKLPDMELIGEILELRKTCFFAPSWNLNYFAIGCTDGTVRLFTNNFEEKNIQEVVRVEETHDFAVVSICFLDDIRVYVTCSVEGQVKFWDFEKQLVKTIQLNIPTCGIVQNGSIGDVVMAQNHYLLTIPKRIWDEDDALNRVKIRHAQDLSAERANDDEQLNNATLSTTSVASASMVSHDESPNSNQTTRLNGVEGRLPSSQVDNVDGSLQTGPSLSVQASFSALESGSKTRRGSVMLSGNGDHKSLRRFSKLNGGGQSVGDLRKRSMLLRKSSKLLSTSSLLSEDDHSVVSNFGTKDPNLLNLDEIEREIVMPALKGKQFFFISKHDSHVLESGNQGAAVMDDESICQDRNNVAGYQDSVEYEYVHKRKQILDMSVLPSDSMIQEMQLQQDMSKPIIGDDFESSSLLGGSSSIANDSNKGVLDVFHPRFLVHKKPPARMLQMEDVGAHVSNIVRLVDKNSEHASKKGEVVNQSNKSAQFGLSPRARMTLLNMPGVSTISIPTRPSQPAPSNRSQSQVSGRLSNFEAVGDLLAFKAQEQLILGLSIGMRVSNEYKQQRSSLSEERQQRFSTLSSRSSFMAPAVRMRRSANITSERAPNLGDTSDDNSLQEDINTQSISNANIPTDVAFVESMSNNSGSSLSSPVVAMHKKIMEAPVVKPSAW
jgi:WD40 repeat protein